ncbi:hypothetical protein JHK85_035759 [Glycine max]|nr:hypothetical protein JHK85_035759 [Glycine max]
MTTTDAPSASTPVSPSIISNTPFRSNLLITWHFRFQSPRSLSRCTPVYSFQAVFHVDRLLPTEAVHFVDASTPFMTVQHSSGVRDIWTISMHNGEQHVDDPWNRLLTDNDLMGGDEVIFYYRPNEHVWEIIFRKEPIWDEDEDST